ncbi:uncharacterized protein LOC111411391, partial [Olea europaea var. sylvestris]|uniref:uncharacterized protein LOC111411391 n=1 Tax=Olea europaea var. sylvestris TaxID=158386 RepID=UPI000C1CE091
MAWWERWFEQRLNRLGSSLWMRKVVVVMMDISVGDWNVGGGGWVPMFCLWVILKMVMVPNLNVILFMRHAAAKCSSVQVAAPGAAAGCISAQRLFLSVLSTASSSATTISANVNSIPILSGTNFKDWKENILIVLGCMDLDLALRVEEPTPLTEESSPDEKRHFERWDRSNRMSLMIIKISISEAFRGVVSEGITNAKDFLVEIEKCFVKNDKVETSMLL